MSDLAEQCWVAGWTVGDLWHLDPPRRFVEGSFARVDISPTSIVVEQAPGRVVWPPCVLLLLAEWVGETDSPTYEVITAGSTHSPASTS